MKDQGQGDMRKSHIAVLYLYWPTWRIKIKTSICQSDNNISNDPSLLVLQANLGIKAIY